MSTGNHDSDELEALFDSIVAETTVKETPPAAAPAETAVASCHCTGATASDRTVGNAAGNDAANEMISRIGHLTRSLHDSLRELGYDRMIADAADAIPDAQDRLRYVADMTEKAASRTLAATEAAQPLQEQLSAEATALSADWEKLYGNELSVDDFKALAGRTRDYLRAVPDRTRETNAQLLEIMMAQDFQDLTGQVIKKMMEMTHKVEQQLLDLLLEHIPSERRAQLPAGGLAGPVIPGKVAADAVTDQSGVDELLESLGF
jgi:chemotaxis protein CheZ